MLVMSNRGIQTLIFGNSFIKKIKLREKINYKDDGNSGERLSFGDLIR